jgi:hypothetical protein
MVSRGLIALPLIALVAQTAPLAAQVIVRQAPGLTIAVDAAHARPGGLVVVRLRSSRPLGFSTALLDGRRAPFFPCPDGLRALVGVPVTAVPGPADVGIEIRGRRGKRQLSVPFTIAPKAYPGRSRGVASDRRVLVESAAALRDSRRLLAALRTASPQAHWTGPLQPPVAIAPRGSFGLAEDSHGGPPFNERLDGVYGEYHRGLDYEAAVGTLVQAPTAGVVLLAAPLTVSGLTLVLDHGQGLLSVLCHLSRIDVREGQWLEGRTPVGLSGDSGVVDVPHLHWGTYVNGVAIDPSVLTQTAF